MNKYLKIGWLDHEITQSCFLTTHNIMVSKNTFISLKNLVNKKYIGNEIKFLSPIAKRKQITIKSLVWRLFQNYKCVKSQGIHYISCYIQLAFVVLHRRNTSPKTLTPNYRYIMYLNIEVNTTTNEVGNTAIKANYYFLYINKSIKFLPFIVYFVAGLQKSIRRQPWSMFSSSRERKNYLAS